jgi:hypothetical protein
MLYLGRAGSAGVEKGVVPVLRDGAVMATVAAARCKEAATAMVGGQGWVFARHERELTGRRTTDAEGTVRLRARLTPTAGEELPPAATAAGATGAAVAGSS